MQCCCVKELKPAMTVMSLALTATRREARMRLGADWLQKSHSSVVGSDLPLTDDETEKDAHSALKAAT